MLETTNKVQVEPVPVDLKVSVSLETMIWMLILALLFLIFKVKK